MKKIIHLVVAGSLAISCSKDNASHLSQTGETDFGNLQIAESFNWSSSYKGNLIVSLKHDPKLYTEGQQVWIIAENGARLDLATVSHDQAEFNIMLPQSGASYYLYYPRTGDSKLIEKVGITEFELLTDFVNQPDLIRNKKVFGTGKKSATAVAAFTGNNLLGNGDFEVNSFASWSSSYTVSSQADNGQWYDYNSRHNWTIENGSYVFKAKNKKSAYAYQIVNVAAADSFKIYADCDPGGIVGLYIDWYDANDSYIGYDEFYNVKDGYNTGKSTVSGIGLMPTDAAYAEIWVYAYNKAWLDNVHFETNAAIVDSDNDGVVDSEDDYPNDGTRAYKSFFPTAGYQTIAFEDLWPAKGDFDFNDMVISTQIVYSSAANGDYVDATVTISLDGMGAGASSGLAMRLLDENQQNFSANIISSISGEASADPNVLNGIIVFDDVKQAQSEYYTNNGNGPTKDADEFTFTIVFTPGVAAIVPDIYIYRTGERGKETHIDGFYGTSLADASLNNTKMDYNGTYNTVDGLPWAIEIVTPDKSFKHPLEKVDVLVAYPNLQAWAQSGGVSSTDWASLPASGKVFEKP